MDIATLGIKVDASSATTANDALDKLADTGAKAESATKKVSKATDELGKAAATARAASTSASGAAASFASGADRSASSVKNAASATQNYEQRVANLLGAVYPTTNALGKLSFQLTEAQALFKSGALSAQEFAGVEATLRYEIDKLAKSQADAAANAIRHANGVETVGEKSKGALTKLLMLGRSIKELATGEVDILVLGEAFNRAGELAEKMGIKTAAAGAEGAAGVGLLDIALAPVTLTVAAIVGGVAVMAGAFAIFAHETSSSIGDVAKSMNLTEEQIEKLKNKGIETTVGFRDVVKATYEEISEDIKSAFDGPLKFVADKFTAVYEFVKTASYAFVKFLVGSFVGGVSAITTAWEVLPGAIGDAAAVAANFVINAVEGMINKVIGGVNGLAEYANEAAKAVGLNPVFGKLDPVSFGRFATDGSAARAGEAVGKALREGYDKGVGYVSSLASRVTDRARSDKESEIREALGKDKEPKSNSGKSGSEAKSDEEKAYDRAIKKSEDYIKSLQKETASIGQNVIQRKQAEAAIEIEAVTKAANTVGTAAATAKAKELTTAIKAQVDAWIKATNQEENRKLVESITDANKEYAFQTSLLGMNEAARAKATAQRQIDLKVQALTRQGYTVEAEALKAVTAEYVANAEAKGKLQDQANAAAVFADHAADIANNLRDASGALGEFFGTAGTGFENLINTVADFGAKKAAIDADLAAKKAQYGEQSTEYELAQQQASKRTADLEKQNVGNMLSAAKTFFKEKSAGYKTLEAAEQAYRAIQFALQAKALIQDGIATVRSIANSGLRGAADGAAAFAKTLASLPFPANIAAGAAVLAALAAVGISIAGGGGGSTAAPVTSAKDRQEAQGTGSVLGDASAQSESLANSLKIVTANSNKDLEYSNQMVRYLKAIDDNIGSLSSLLAKQLGVSGGAFSTDGLNLGTNTKASNILGSIPLIGGLFGKTTTKTELNDQGLDFGSASVGQVIANGISANIYQEVLKTVTKSGFLGIGKSTKTSTSTVESAASSDLTSQVSVLIGSLKTSIVAASKTIGIDSADALLDSFQINIGKISLKDLTGKEIEEQLNAVFSKLGDDMVSAIYGDISQFQKVGEGALETIVRLGKDYRVVDTALKSIGKTFNQVGLSSLAARERLIDLAGSVDDFISQNTFYRENFLSEAEQMAPVISSVADEMKRLGLEGVTTKEQFKNIVQGLDLSTESGAELYTALMAVAPAFAKVADYTDEMAASVTKALQDALSAANTAVSNAQTQLQNAYTAQQKVISDALAAAQKSADEAAANVASARETLKSAYDATVENINNTAAALDDIATTAAENLSAARDTLSKVYDAAISDAQETLSKAQAIVQSAKDNLKQLYESALSEIDSKVEAASANVEAARSDLTAAYNAESSAIKATIDKFKAFRDSLKAFREELNGQQYSQLSPENNYNQTKAEFQRLSSLAAGGDEDAISKLQDASKAFLDASKDYNASGSGYFDDLKTVKDAIDKSANAADAQVSNAEAQLNALNASVSNLIDIKDRVLSVRDALLKLQSARDAEAQAKADADAQKAALRELVGSYIDLDDTNLTIADNIKNLLSGREQENLAQEQIDKLNSQLQVLLGTNDSLLSIDDATQQFLVALKQNDIAVSAAAQAKEDAKNQLASLDKQVDGLLAANDNLVSIDKAVADLRSSIATNEVAQAVAAQAKSDADMQTALLNQQVAGLLQVNASVVSVADAITQLNGALSAQAAAQAAIAAATQSAIVATQDKLNNVVQSVQTIQVTAQSSNDNNSNDDVVARLDSVITELQAANVQRGAGNQELSAKLADIADEGSTNGRLLRLNEQIR